MGFVGLGRGLLLILLLKKTNWAIRRAPRKYARSFESHAYAPQGAYSSSPPQIKKAPLRELFLFVLAERVGFEPTVRFNVRLISSQVHSTTLPPLLLLRSFLTSLREGKIIAARRKKESNFLYLLRFQMRQAAHVRAQHCRDLYAAVGLLVVFQYCYQRAADCQAGAVQGVGQFWFAGGVAEARLHAACLEGFAVRQR